MPPIAMLMKLEEGQVVHALHEVGETLDGADGEMVLDFSSVHRIDPAVLSAMEEVAEVAESKGVKLALRGVNIQVYKVLKLAKLAPRFSFLL